MIATLAEVSLDSADPEGLMRFYQLVLGGEVADHQPHPAQYRVFIDPAGHPFCACLPADWA